jgi:hypothetical protein
MSTQTHTPSWKWAEDGDTVRGKVRGLRQVESKFKPGTLVTVMDVEVSPGDTRSLWMDSYGLRRFIEVSMPTVGDTVLIQRTGKKEFQTKSGETRSMWEYATEVLPPQANDLPVAEVQAPAVVDDSDIPF